MNLLFQYKEIDGPWVICFLLCLLASPKMHAQLCLAASCDPAGAERGLEMH